MLILIVLTNKVEDMGKYEEVTTYVVLATAIGVVIAWLWVIVTYVKLGG